MPAADVDASGPLAPIKKRTAKQPFYLAACARREAACAASLITRHPVLLYDYMNDGSWGYETFFALHMRQTISGDS